jgi:hypothetical protein
VVKRQSIMTSHIKIGAMVAAPPKETLPHFSYIAQSSFGL